MKVLSPHLGGGTEENHEEVSQDSPHSGRDPNRASPEYEEARALAPGGTGNQICALSYLSLSFLPESGMCAVCLQTNPAQYI
jgi:hypothetical protein